MTFTNTGNTSWSSIAGYELAITTDTCGLVSVGAIPFPPNETIAPGAQKSFDIVLNIPASGPCTLGVRMSQPGGVGQFGDPLSLNFNIVTPVNNAQMISNTLPVTMEPNLTIGYGFTIRNTGNTAWYPGSNHALAVIGTPCMIPATTRIYPQPGDVILPNQQFICILYLTSPAQTGPCNIDLQMVEESVEFFGQTLNVSIDIQVPPNAVRGWTDYE